MAHPDQYDPEKYFQRAWSGERFKNIDWASENGDGKIYPKYIKNFA